MTCLPINNLPIIIAHLENRLSAVEGSRGGVDEELGRLDELKRMACLCAALQKQDELMDAAFSKAGITV